MIWNLTEEEPQLSTSTFMTSEVYHRAIPMGTTSDKDSGDPSELNTRRSFTQEGEYSLGRATD